MTRFLSLKVLQERNQFLRRAYQADYRGSAVPAALRLELPTPARLAEGFARIRSEMAVPETTLHEIVASVVDGKHVLLYGPPGTGKTTLAGLVAQLFDCESRFETAVADWTPFETIGGFNLTSADGKEGLAPVAGVITEAVVSCLERIAARHFDGIGPQGTWLILDELNRANMDAAFGQFFTALDPNHPRVSLPFFDGPRRELHVPHRFRLIGTMNTYDKNFLFRLSYALTRRFALVPVDVPANSDEAARSDEKAKLWMNLRNALSDQGVREATVDELRRDYEASLMAPLYDDLTTAIRAEPVERPEGLGRSIGFAQVASALRHAVLELELKLTPRDRGIRALDHGVRSAIVPQLEGLSNASLDQFVRWWSQHEDLLDMSESIAGVREQIRTSSLFVVD